MSTRINISIDDGGLVDRNAQQQAAARQANQQRATAEKAAAEGQRQLEEERIRKGLDPLTGERLPSAGSSSRIQRIDQEPAAFRREEGIGWLLPSNFTFNPDRIDCKVSNLKNKGLFPYRPLVQAPINTIFEPLDEGLVVINKSNDNGRDIIRATDAVADLSIGGNAITFDPETNVHTGSNGILSRTRTVKLSNFKSFSFECIVKLGTIDRFITGQAVTWRYFWTPAFDDGSGTLRSTYTTARLTFWEDGTPEPQPDPWEDPVTRFGWPQYTSGPVLVITTTPVAPRFLAAPAIIRIHFYENEEDVNADNVGNIGGSTPATRVDLILDQTSALFNVASAVGMGTSLRHPVEGHLFTKQHIKVTVKQNQVRFYLSGQQVGTTRVIDNFLDPRKFYYVRVFLRTGTDALNAASLYIGNNNYLRNDSPLYGVKLKTNTPVTTTATYEVPETLLSLG
jgi:hypothetical protein